MSCAPINSSVGSVSQTELHVIHVAWMSAFLESVYQTNHPSTSPLCGFCITPLFVYWENWKSHFCSCFSHRRGSGAHFTHEQRCCVEFYFGSSSTLLDWVEAGCLWQKHKMTWEQTLLFRASAIISTVDLPVDYILAELVVCLKDVIPCFPKLKMTPSNVTFGPEPKNISDVTEEDRNILI